MESRVRSSVQQFSTLLEFMERHGDLAKPSPGPQGRLRSDQLWMLLAENLNTMGVQKSPDKWKKVWADWKMKTKKKAITKQRQEMCPGINYRSTPILTPFEERLLVLMTSSNEDVKEQGSDNNEGFSHSSTPSSNLSFIEIAIDDEPLSQSPTQSSKQQQNDKSMRYTSEQTTNSSATSPRRLLARARRRQAYREYLATEQRRLRLEEMREKNESRRIEVEQERNNVLNRFADIAQTLLDHHLNRENTVGTSANN